MTDRRDVPQDDDTQPIDSSFFSPAPEPQDRVGLRELDGAAGASHDPRALVRAGSPSGDRAGHAKPADRSTGTGVGTILAACFLSAALASGGTFAALSATGAFDATSAAPVSNADPTSVRQPVTIDENSAIVDVAATAGPAVVRIVTGDIDPNALELPEQGVGSGVIFNPNGWILTNRHVVAGSRLAHRRAQGRDASIPARSTASTR